MTTPITVENPKELNLTNRELLASDREPLYIGTLWKLRLQVRDADDAAKSLSGATIVMTITDGTNTATRKTGVTSTGASAAQIVIDADQVTEDTVNYTGKGWCEIRFDAVAADVSALAPFANRKVPYDIGIKFGDSITQVVFVAGKIDANQAKTTFPIT